MSIILCIAAFLVSLCAGRISRLAGLVTTLGIGYVYGIIRANVPETFSHFIFDAAVLGFYLTQFSGRFSSDQQRKIHGLKPWLELLMLWPILLFFIPIQSWLVQLIGLRGNVFLLPFLLIGCWLEPQERYQLALWIGAFNVVALVFGGIEFFVGVEPFFPKNAVTYLIYKSKDLVGHSEYRIPSFFNNSHAYAGTLVVTLPLLVGALVQRHAKVWAGKLLAVALAATLLGIFIAAARLPVVIAAVVVFAATLSLRKRIGYALGWLFLLVLVGWVVSGEERLQRFTQLADTDAVVQRVGWSVNTSFVELANEHPFGNGLGGGGTSMPYWMEREVQNPLGIENEYGRIMLEQGLLGLGLWVGFIIWVLSRRSAGNHDPWALGWRLAWVTSAASFAAALIGTGLVTAVPQTCIFLLNVGWVVTAQPLASEQPLAERRPLESIQPSTAGQYS